MIVRRIGPRRFVLLVLALGSLALSGWYQAPSSSAAQVPAPTIRVTTHLVLVDVVVTDKQGNPVSGLRREDFAVEENGKAQKIATFATPAESRAAETGGELPPGIYSNRPQYRTPPGPITLLLLDAINTPFKDQAYARLQMLRFVQQQYKPGQRMGIFTLTNSLGILQDFTSDPQVLYMALEQYKPQAPEFTDARRPVNTAGQGTPNTAAVVAALDPSAAPLHRADAGSALRPAGFASVAVAQQALRSFQDAQVAYVEDRRVEVTLSAMNSLARILGGMPGRKTIIWVTGGFPFSLIPENRAVSQAELEETLPSLYTRRVGEHAEGNYAATSRQSHADKIRETAARLSTAQVAVYPVDARGLAISIDQDAQETMKEMARETGGRAYVNQNEIREGVAVAFADNSATYTLGYYPENKKWDGKYRQIKVKVSRDGVETRSRRGYYAIDPTQIKGYNASQEVASALADVVPATLVGFTAQVKPPSANAGKGKIGITFLVDASTLSAEDASGGKRLNVVFYAAVYSPEGKMVTNSSQKVDQTFPADVYQQILQHGVMLQMDLDSLPGNNELRLAVQDVRTGLVGTISAALTQ